MSNLIKGVIATIILVSTIISNGLGYDFTEDTSFYVTGFSKHVGVDGDFNEVHDLIGIEHKNFFIGTYNNSYYDQTYLATYNFKWSASEHFESDIASYFNYGFTAGMSYGYDCDYIDFAICKNKFMPVITPYIEFDKYFIKPNVSILGNAFFITFRIGK
ncbi:hypothetical protein MOU93_004443 [Vibrio parahaemolyticus]|nr:hypothetical protein [Vibrio parahaemolyticus]